MSEHKGNYSRLLGVLLLVFVGVIAWFVKPTTLNFGQNILKDIPTMLGYLVLISLFVERAIEVFLSAWRSAGADELDGKMTNITKQITDRVATLKDQNADVSSNRTEIERLKGELESFKKERTQYRSDSRLISQWLGLGFGILIALVGVRVLGNIVDIGKLTEPQIGIFNIVDIILTGAVLAGGSEAINKITKVYNRFMTSTEERTR